MQLTDRIHHALAQLRINIFSRVFYVRGREMNRLPDDDRYFMPMNFAANRPRFIGTENPHRHNRGERFCDQEAETRQARMKMTIRRARTFREYERALARLDDLDQCFERAPIDRFLIDWDDV